MQTLITERNDTPLLGMDWMKKFDLTIGNIRLEDNSQSEKRRVIRVNFRTYSRTTPR